MQAIIVAATESEPVSLETVTETFSTTETRQKTSILPYLRGGETSLMTLTQTYSITRIVVAVKTLPPLHLYQFIPSKTLTDVNTRLLVNHFTKSKQNNPLVSRERVVSLETQTRTSEARTTVL